MTDYESPLRQALITSLVPLKVRPIDSKSELPVTYNHVDKFSAEFVLGARVLITVNAYAVFLVSAMPPPVGGYLTPAEADALFLTPAEGDTAYVNATGDTMSGRLIVPGVTILTSNTIQWNTYAGNLWMQDVTWLRWDKSVYLGTGVLATDGTLAVKTGGNVTSGYCADFNGSIRVATGSINGYTISTTVSPWRIVCTDSSGYIFGNYINMTADIGAGYPPYMAGQNGDNYLRWYNKSGVFAAASMQSNANSASWSTVAYLAYPGAGYAAAAFHCGSVAVVIASVNGTGHMLYVRDSAFNPNSANVAAANFSLESSRRWKRNIQPYPLRAAGATSPRPSDVVAQLNPITFETTAPDTEVPTLRRANALTRLNSLRTSKGEPDYVLPEHDCGLHNCNGTPENPCARVLNRQQMSYGLIAEEVYAVLPEAVHLDQDRQPAAIHLGQLLSVAVAAIKELTDRVKTLEGTT